MIELVGGRLESFRSAEAGAVDRERRAAGVGKSGDGDIEERSVASWPSECQNTNGTPPSSPPKRTRTDVPATSTEREPTVG